MKKEEISDAIGLMDDEMITKADTIRKKRRGRRPFYMAGVALAACLCLVIGAVLQKAKPANAFTIAEAKYPVMERYPDEKNFIDKQGEVDYEALSAQYEKWRENKDTYLEGASDTQQYIAKFALSSTKEFLGKAKDKNVVFSPLNVYIALSMLAEVSGSDTRDELLNVLGVDSIDTLRKTASNLWKSNYCDDGATTSILGNSLWLNKNVDYKQNTMDTLANKYFASSYKGTMGSDEMTKKLQDWLDKQTGGLQKEQAKNIELEPETIMAIASTIYFKARWELEFNNTATKEDIFHSKNGDVNCDFMHQSREGLYYYGDKYSAISLPFADNGSMWFILPDEGATTEELINNNTVMNLPLHGGDSKYMIINVAMPKFDVSSNLDLVDGLKSLGIKKVFDGSASDFSPMAAHTDGVYVSSVEHAARVQVDEKGCTAAAFTVMMMKGTLEPAKEEVDFVLNRPFLFVITGASGTPLFTGVVNQPSN